MRFILTEENCAAFAARRILARAAAVCPSQDRPFVLGLPTGSTVLGTYAALRTAYAAGKISFRHILSFNMDEYIGLPEDHPQSYHTYMRQNLFDHVDMPRENIHILDGNATDPQAQCAAYEAAIRQAGGIDLFLGGVGRNGHLAFNEPGTDFSSRTRRVVLAPATLQANARFFGGDPSRVPTEALTIGIVALTDAREILILATGPSKAHVIGRLLEEPPNTANPVSVLRMHPNAVLVADTAAGAEIGQAARAKLRPTAESEGLAGWAADF